MTSSYGSQSNTVFANPPTYCTSSRTSGDDRTSLHIVTVLRTVTYGQRGDPVQTIVNGIFNENFNIHYYEALSGINMYRSL